VQSFNPGTSYSLHLLCQEALWLKLLEQGAFSDLSEDAKKRMILLGECYQVKKIVRFLLLDIYKLLLGTRARAWVHSQSTAKIESSRQGNNPCTHGDLTALMLAAKYEHAVIVNELLRDYRENIDKKNQTGESALVLTIKYGHLDVSTVLSKAIIELKLLNEATIDHILSPAKEHKLEKIAS
jgi:hypothetical protein